MVANSRSFPISGEKVRKARNDKFWSQDVLAAKLIGKVAAGTIKRIEQAEDGTVRVFAATLREIAEVLGVEPRSLLHEEHDDQGGSEVPAPRPKAPNIPGTFKASDMRTAASPEREAERGKKPKRGK